MRTLILLLLLVNNNLFAAKAHIKALAEYQTTLNPGTDTRAYAFTNTITTSIWVKFNTLDAGVSQELMAKGAATGAVLFDVRNLSQKIQFYYANPNATFHIWTTTATQVSTNIYTHIAVVFTYGTAASLIVYINGDPVAGSWTSGTGTVLGLTNAVAFHIASNEPSGTPYLDGIESEVAVWNCILTANQIASLAKSRCAGITRQIRPDLLKFYMPQDDKPEGFTTNPPNGNKTLDRGPFLDHMDTGGTYIAQRALSYQPNE